GPPVDMTLVVAVCVQIALPYNILVTKVNSVVPTGKLFAVVFKSIGLVIEAEVLDVHKVLTIASIVIPGPRVANGTSKIEAVAALHELSLIADEIIPEL